MAKILYGQPIADEIKKFLKYEIQHGIEKYYLTAPQLKIIQCNKNDASNVYVRNKIRFCEECGIEVNHINIYDIIPQAKWDDETTRDMCLFNTIVGYSQDIYPRVIVQSPVDSKTKFNEFVNVLPSNELDVDCLCDTSVGRLWQDRIKFKGKEALTVDKYYINNAPATPNGIYAMLRYYQLVDGLKGKHAVIIGRSDLVGKPMAKILLDLDMTVTICHSKSENLKDIAKTADLLVVAIGKPKFITKEYIKEGAVVIDVGINRDENNKLCGDVDFENVLDHVSAITPVPKGVGIVTTAMVALKTYYLWDY